MSRRRYCFCHTHWVWTQWCPSNGKAELLIVCRTWTFGRCKCTSCKILQSRNHGGILSHIWRLRGLCCCGKDSEVADDFRRCKAADASVSVVDLHWKSRLYVNGHIADVTDGSTGLYRGESMWKTLQAAVDLIETQIIVKHVEWFSTKGPNETVAYLSSRICWICILTSLCLMHMLTTGQSYTFCTVIDLQQ